MNSNKQTHRVFASIKLLIPSAIIVIAAFGCTFSSEPDSPEIPEFPDVPELPLSEASDRARIERTLPWTVIEETCGGIDARVPIIEFATAAGTSQHEATENLKINEYVGEVWKSSMLLMELTAKSKHPRSFYSTITYYESEAWASLQHEQLESLRYETTLLDTAQIAQSSPNDIPAVDDRSSDQLYVFDDRVYSKIVVVYGNGVEPFCSRDELYALAEQLVAGSK
jgi:hypothetical protein